jgi:hypothetical protein
MIIHASEKFRCAHEYIATPEDERLVFLCSRCRHRTELLPLQRSTPPGRVVTFRLPENTAPIAIPQPQRVPVGPLHPAAQRTSA